MPHSLRDLFIEELQDLHSAEQQIVDALPQLVAAASASDLKRAFNEHLEQTRVQRERLELILKSLNAQPGAHCKGMEGLIKEGRERLRQDSPSDVKDAALISAAQAASGTRVRWRALYVCLWRADRDRALAPLPAGPRTGPGC